MSNKTEQLIHFEENSFNNAIDSLESFIPLFQKSISLYNEMELAPFENKNFIQFILDPGTFLFNAIMEGKTQQVAGMAVSKEKLFDLLEKPKGYFTLIQNIKEIREKVEGMPRHYKFSDNHDSFLDYFEFDGKGKLRITEEIRERVKRRNSIFISSDSTKEMYKFLLDAKELFNKSDVFKKSITPPFMNIYRFFDDYLSLDEKKVFSLKIDRIAAQDNHISNYQ